MQSQIKLYGSTKFYRLQIQGVQDLDQATADEVGSWLRLAVGVCAVLAATGTLLAGSFVR